jgi:PTS system mannitol-specific IIC component
LLAYTLFGKGSAKSSAPGAVVIQFLGGIHEIYFPYVMMKPVLFLAVIGGGVSGTFVFQLLNAGLQAAASPGSIIAILGMAPKGGHLPVIAGVAVAAVVSFLISMVILKSDRSTEDEFAATQEAVAAAKAESKGQAQTAVVEETVVEAPTADKQIDKIIFACDAGMGSSAMGASVLRNMIKKAGVDVPVTNSAINNLKDEPNTLIVTQVELYERAKQKAPSSDFVTVENFMNSPRYEEVVNRMKEQ